MSFVVRSSQSLQELAGPIKAAISSVSANVPIFRMKPLESLVHSAMAQRRFTLLLVAAFAGVAVLLAALGLYGVVAYSVRQRTREIGVRMALGAAPARIVEMVARESAWMLGVGALAGVLGALAMNRLLAHFLFGVGPADPWSFLAAGVVLVVAAALATALPLWRATRVDAGVALAAE
jgi:ABC-type antimicrobial peptide transport system permease subunit